jgi:hypothetical protein
MAAKKSSSSAKRTRTPPAQGVLPESSRLPRAAASSPASRVVKERAPASKASSRTPGASAAEARALLGLEQGTPGAGGRTTGERAGRSASRPSRAPSAEDLAREAVRRERPQAGGALKDFNLRTGRDVTALRQRAGTAAAPARTPPGGRANARSAKDKGGASLRTRR